jgi:hypothetical protein
MSVKHIEKFSLVLAICLVVLSFFLFSSYSAKSENNNYKNDLFESKKRSGTEYFIFRKEISIMPGELLSFYNEESELAESYEVQNILIPSRQEIEIITEDKKIKGTSRQEVIFEKNWRSLPGVFSIRQNKETIQIKLSDVVGIRGKLWLKIDANLKTLNDEDLTVSFYQKTTHSQTEAHLPERLKWINSGTEENQSAYDLFTPPIIYIHNGELTTRLPEKEVKEEKIEPFGLSLVGVTKAEYPLRLKSWVGNTPYFEDLATIEDGTGKIIRNRIEVGKPHKRVEDRKPGQQSFEICDSNDTDKIFTVQYFAVQQYRNPETGGLKPVGRAMIQDHKLGGKPFEINTLMKGVYAGNMTFNFMASLPGLDPKEFSFSSSDSLATLEYGGRKYLVSEIDLESKTLRVTKQDPRLEEDSYQTFSF